MTRSNDSSSPEKISEPDPASRVYADHVPVIIGNCAPFRLVLRDDDEWAPTLEQINNKTYDYLKLCRPSGSIDIGIEPFSLIIGFDGSLILPALQEFIDRRAVLTKFNKTLGKMLLGGIYSEAIKPMDISLGSMHTGSGYIRHHGTGIGLRSGFHRDLREGYGGAIDTMELRYPRRVQIKELINAYYRGARHFAKLGRYSPSLLLNGVSSYVNQEWQQALIFLWTAVEQVVELIWEKLIIGSSREETEIEQIKHRSQFLRDYRSWTKAVKLELLYQKQCLPISDYKLLSQARKARNEFAHRGLLVTKEDASSALDSLFHLISLIITEHKDRNTLDSVIRIIRENEQEEHFQNRGRTVIPDDALEGAVWLPMKPHPGDPSWGNQPYETRDALVSVSKKQ